MNPHRSLPALLIAATLLAAGCGSDDADDSAPAPTEAPTAEEPATTEAPAEPTTQEDEPEAEPTSTTTTTTEAPAEEPDPGPQGPVVYPLDGDTVFPEGMAYDPTTDTLFASSSANGPIHRIDRATGETSIWDTDDAACPNSHGLAVDVERALLWVAGQGAAFVKALDLTDGSMVACVELAPGGFINDLTTAPDGTVYATDATLSTITAIRGDARAGNLTVEVIADPASMGIELSGIGTNGIVVDDDGSLIVAHTFLGALLRVDPDTGSAERIAINGQTEGGVPFTDGLMIDGDTLWSVAGDGVHRLEFADRLEAATVEILTDPSFDFPTTGALIGGTRLAVANSQFDSRQNPTPPFTVTEIDAFG